MMPMTKGELVPARTMRLTKRARLYLMRERLRTVADHSARCTCGACVIARLQAEGKLKRVAR